MNSITQKVVPASPSLTKPKKRSVFYSRLKRRLLKHIWVARVGILTFVALFLFLVFLVFSKFLSNSLETDFPKILYSFVFAPVSGAKSIEGRTNIALLGKAGKGHAGEDLTDTIVLVSVSLRRPSLVLISLPRDIWVPELRAKINSAYYWGNQKQEGGGLVLAKSEIEKIVGIPIQYAVVLDFSAFTRIIDVLGGVEVNVARAFTDNKYPLPGRENDLCGGDIGFKCRYETLRFAEGRQFMDGETALKFVRSRNAEGDEGTDIAREARQQKIIVAVKEKILSPKILFNPEKLFSIWRVVDESVETDIPQEVGANLARRIFDSRKNIDSFVIPDRFLENPPISPRYDNQYVFIPKAGNWDEEKAWVREKLGY